MQEGHCEYFATSMALMLRSRGLPARLVNGFAGAEWNPVGAYWLVRQDHAHSWVELWFPDSGWVLFDPTPSTAGGLDASARRSLRAQAGAWADYGRMLWADVMLDYDLGNQAAGFQAILRRLRAWGQDDAVVVAPTPRGPSPTEERGGWGRLAWLLGAALGAGGLALFLRSRGPWSPALAPTGRAVSRLHRRLEAAARRVPGAPREPAAPLELARWAAGQDAERFGEAPGAVEGWYAARYGDGPLPAGLTAQVRRLARRARSWSPKDAAKG